MLFRNLTWDTSTLKIVYRKQLCMLRIPNSFQTSQAFCYPNPSTRIPLPDIRIDNFCFRIFGSLRCSEPSVTLCPENFLPSEVFHLYFYIPSYFNTPKKSLAKLIASFIKPLIFLFLMKFFMKRLYKDLLGT